MTVYAEALLSRRAVGRAALWLGAAALIPGCRQPAPPVRAGTYGDSPEELHRLWSAILAACQSDDRGRVHDLLASFIMTPAELAGLIGPQKAGELWPRYQAMMGSLCNAGAVELVAHVYEKKYDDVSVTRIDPPPPEASSPPARPTAPSEAAKLIDLTEPVDTDRAVLRDDKANRLYKPAMVRITAEYNVVTREYRAARLIEFVEHDPRWDEREFARLTERGAKAWKDVPDASVWVDVDSRLFDPARQRTGGAVGIAQEVAAGHRSDGHADDVAGHHADGDSQRQRGEQLLGQAI